MSLKLNSSGGGSVTLQEPVTASDLTLNLPTTSGTVVLDGGSPTFSALTVNGNNISAVNSMGFRNRIINGDMSIDQRNAGASVAFAAGVSGYNIDRWSMDNSTDGALTIQQSAIAPTGFTNSLFITVTTADASLASGQRCRISQRIEGFNFSDFAWGSANAQTATLSFWVRSSLTGTFGGAIRNASFNRSYAFSYTISAANTWEQKTVTITGDTTGTWNTSNGIGLELGFGLGAASDLSGTAGSWTATANVSATGATSVIGTNGATFYVTGVQLEAGTVATPFERIDYGRELMLCQRYLPVWSNRGGAGNAAVGVGQLYNTTQAVVVLPYTVTPRVQPTGIVVGGGVSYVYNAGATLLTASSLAFNSASLSGLQIVPTFPASGTAAGYATNLLFDTSCFVYATGCEL